MEHFFPQGLAEELSKEGACERAIFPDTSTVITRCGIFGNPSATGVSNFSEHYHGNSCTFSSL